MYLERRFFIQDRATSHFVGIDFDEEPSLVPMVTSAKPFDDAEEAVLNGIALCSEGYVMFSCFVEVQEGG